MNSMVILFPGNVLLLDVRNQDAHVNPGRSSNYFYFRFFFASPNDLQSNNFIHTLAPIIEAVAYVGRGYSVKRTKWLEL